jgi:hypothetical protein
MLTTPCFLQHNKRNTAPAAAAPQANGTKPETKTTGAGATGKGSVAWA